MGSQQESEFEGVTGTECAENDEENLKNESRDER
jgi:hypothetical protein